MHNPELLRRQAGVYNSIAKIWLGICIASILLSFALHYYGYQVPELSRPVAFWTWWAGACMTAMGALTHWRASRLETWLWKPLESGEILACPARFKKMKHHEIPISILIKVHTTTLSLPELARKSIGARASMVPPRLFDVHGFTAMSYEWVYGVREVETVFVSLSPDKVGEINYSVDPNLPEEKVPESFQENLNNYIRTFITPK